jgi:AraC family transcriptional regulator
MGGMASVGAARSAAPVKLQQAERSGGYDRRVPISDPIVHHLGVCLHRARSRPSEVSQICVDHVASALQAYLRRNSNVITFAPPVARGGLAPWQLRRAKEIMSTRLDEAVPLAELAQACNLSPGHFARAFKQATGQPPHRWLLEQRIEKSKELLADSAMSLAEIAIACGFADQSHFTRVFTRTTRSSPGAWRRYRRTGPSSTGGSTEAFAYQSANSSV